MARLTNIQHRRDTAANWTSVNPTLAAGELGFETNTLKFKIGDGSTAWNALAYQNGQNGNAYIVDILDGGASAIIPDIVYDAGTSSTTTWTYTIDAGASTVNF